MEDPFHQNLDMKIKITPIHDTIINHFPNRPVCKCIRSESVTHEDDNSVMCYNYLDHKFFFRENNIETLHKFCDFIRNKIFVYHKMSPIVELKCNDYTIVLTNTIVRDCVYCTSIKYNSDYCMNIYFDIEKPTYYHEPVKHINTNTYRVAKKYEIGNVIDIPEDEINGLVKINGLSFIQVLEMYKKDLIANANHDYCNKCFDDNDDQAQIVLRNGKYYLLRLCKISYNELMLRDYTEEYNGQGMFMYQLTKKLKEKTAECDNSV